MIRKTLMFGLLMLLASVVFCTEKGKFDTNGNTAEEVDDQLVYKEQSSGGNPEKVTSEDNSEQRNTEEEDARKSYSKRSYSGYRSGGSRYSKLLPSWMTMDHLVNQLVKAHLRGMIVKKLRQERQAKAELDRMKSDDCQNLEIKSVGHPVVHTTYGNYHQGVWMKDPLEYLGAGRIWVMDGYYNQHIVKEFASYTDFKAGIVHKTHRLPYHWDGTGAVVYGPYLYYNRKSSNHIVKFDLRNDQMVKQQGHGYYNKVRSYQYQWGGYSGMDLAVDESGLWVLSGYSGYSGRLAATMIDPVTLYTRHAWNVGGEAQNSMGNAFVACGVVYTVDTYSGTTRINNAYDTRTGRRWNPNISFKWPFSYGSSLDYNPKEKMLYAWVAHHQVTYSLKFGKKP